MTGAASGCMQIMQEGTEKTEETVLNTEARRTNGVAT